jgi:predicted aminopeptidase
MARTAVALLLPALLGACYLTRQAMGQARILLTMRPLQELIEDPSVPDEARRKLLRIREVKAFGERHMGLTPSRNYEDYYDTSGRPITFIVTACAKDGFRPHTWWFPVVGEVPYKGFFDFEAARAEARALEEAGLDVSLGSAAAYSTLGYFPDPVLSTMLDHPEEELCALILHELTHGTIYLPGGTDFNEGLASFTGWQGALEFARSTRGSGSLLYERSVEGFARAERRDRRALALYRRLREFYEGQPDREERVRGREAIFAAHHAELRREWETARAALRDLQEEAARKEREGGVGPLAEEIERAERRRREAEGEFRRAPVNNAEVLQLRRYGRFDEFRARFEAVGGRWPAFFAALRKPEATSTSP